MHEDLTREFDMSDRVAVVTGAGSGIGRETAIALAQAGASVVLADVNGAGLSATAELVEALGQTAIVCPTDITRRAEVETRADTAMRAGDRVDAWINAAGVLTSFAILDAQEADLDHLLSVNLKGTYWCCAAAGRVMKPRGTGSIVNISSAAADNPVPLLSGYAITKAALNMLTRTAALEFGAFGCRVNAIGPGFIDTPMVAPAYLDDDGAIDPVRREAFFQMRAQATPLGITGRPRDIALAAVYLASDASRFVTGQVLRPNGGVAMR